MVMRIKAIVAKADYDNIVRTYWEKEDIDAEIEVDGVLHEKGEIAFRGSSSLNFPKKGFKVKFKKKNLYKGNTKRIDLSASYVDKSLIRERLSFDLFGKTRVVASKAWHVDFSIHSKEGALLEQGLFTGIEHLDEYFFRNRNREVGNLYKADGNFVNGIFLGAVLDSQPEAVLRLLYDKDETKKIAAKGFFANLLRSTFSLPPIQTAEADEESYDDLIAFIQVLNSGDSNAITRYLDRWLDVAAYLDYLAVNTLVQSNDTYHKNYFVHNRFEDDKWEVIPWDYDLTWGRNWVDYCDGLCDDLSEGTSLKGSAQLTNRLSRHVFNTPAYFERLRARLADLLGSEFTEEKLFPKIDAYYAEIRELVHQDSRKWPTNEQFEHERERLKDWIRRRRRFLFKELGTTPAPAKLADTIVAGVGFDRATVIAGAAVTFEATVKNIGGAATGNTVGVAFLVDGNYVTFGTSGALGVGAERLIKSVSTWRATPGDHTLTAVVDDVNRYPEIREDNNTLQTNFRVMANEAPSLSDVVIEDLAFERETTGRVRLAALVANIGKAQTGDLVGVAFFINEKYVTFGTIPPLAAGERKPVRAGQTLSLTGRHKVTALADDVNRFPEESEANNSRTEQIDFGGATGPTLADTIILEVKLGDAGRFSEGDQLTFEAVVRNIGTATTGDVVGVAFSVDGQYITFGNSAPIPPGETRAIRAVSPWRAVAGRHQLIAEVDDINRYPELSETNNRFALDFQVFKRNEASLPDSTVNQLGFEKNGAGQVILTATVANIGPVKTPDVVGVAFFVDGQYRTYGVTQPMAPNATEVIRAVQPLSLSGRHTITAIVDDVNRYDELSHQNNALAREFSFA